MVRHNIQQSIFADYVTDGKQVLNEYKGKSPNVIAPGDIPGWDKVIPNVMLGKGMVPSIKGLEPDPETGYVPQSYDLHVENGTTTMQGVIASEVYRKALYRGTRELSTGMKICYTETFDNLLASWQVPTELEFTHPIPVEAAIPKVQSMNYWTYDMSLQKGGMAIYISDASRIINDIPQFKKDFKKRQAEAIRKAVDDNILNTLIAGAGAGTAGVLRDVGADDKWDASGANQPYIVQDFALAMSELLDTTLREEARLDDPVFACGPVSLRPLVNMKPSTVDTGSTGGIAVTSKEDFVITDLQKANIGMTYTRNALYQNDVLMGWKGEDTAVHGVYGGNEIPLVEQERRRGAGIIMHILRIFNTFVVPYGDGQTLSKMLGLITDIYAE